MAQAGRIYVTGAAGMIGSTLSRALLAEGHEVIGIDNLWRGTRRNLEELCGDRKFEFRHADLVSDHDWQADMDRASVLVHTADLVGGIAYVLSNEWQIFQKNLLINTQIARTVNRVQPSRLIYLGTACSYPQGLQRSVETSVLRETDKLPADPESGYGWSKLLGEIELGLAVKGTATRLTVLDLHNVYGWPCTYRDQTAQVLPSLVYRALRAAGGDLVVWGDGRQGRAFLHLRDVASGVLKALAYEGEHRTFMLGPDRCTTIGELAALIAAHPRVNVRAIVYDTSMPTGDIGRHADSSLARQELGWRISVPLETGLRELVDDIHCDMTRAPR